MDLLENNNAARVEQDCVYDVYDEIADHFSETRFSHWPGVKWFLSSIPAHSVVLDVGCGNGKYLSSVPSESPHLLKLGCDRTAPLCDIAAVQSPHVFVADCLALPVRSQSVDAVMSIAVIHHMATEDRRIIALRELIRVLRVGGSALVFVWAFEQAKDGKRAIYLKENAGGEDVVPETAEITEGIRLPVHKNRTPFVSQDVLVPWQKCVKGKAQPNGKYLRYYHVFREGELRCLCEEHLQNAVVDVSWYEQGNWCVRLTKTGVL